MNQARSGLSDSLAESRGIDAGMGIEHGRNDANDRAARFGGRHDTVLDPDQTIADQRLTSREFFIERHIRRCHVEIGSKLAHQAFNGAGALPFGRVQPAAA